MRNCALIHIRPFLISIFAGFACACETTHFSKQNFCKKNYHLKNIPAGVIRIDQNYFCDETEVSNISYVEYLYWIKNVFGKKSNEYLEAFPDTSVWSAIDKCMFVNDIYYLRHPAYRVYPVVGVTKLQAENFSKWRSDRVFEFILISAKVIPYTINQTSSNYFSIDRYFEGRYSNYVPDTNYYYVPYYRLPSVQEYLRNRRYADSIDPRASHLIHCDMSPCINDTLKNDPTIYENYPKTKVQSHYIYNLRGNVRELTSEEGVSVGGSWRDNRQIILSNDTFNFQKANAMTGFRNVCEWKRWTKKDP